MSDNMSDKTGDKTSNTTSNKGINLLCKGGCGEVFSAFLTEMAEKNAKVTCPKCGMAHDYDASAAETSGSDSPHPRS